MARLLEELERPYGREHYELIKAGRGEMYLRAADGLIIRLAAAAETHESERIARKLFLLALKYALAQ